jgi:hypothetical protein
VKQCADNLVHALSMDAGLMPVTRVVTLPAQRITMGALAAEIARQCDVSTDLVSYRSDAGLEAAFGAHPPLSTPAAERAGFAHDGDLATLVTNALGGDRARVRGSEDDAVSAARPQLAGGARRAADRTQRQPGCRAHLPLPICHLESALGRLRDYFGDELLVVKGRQMVLTSRAEELVEPVRAVLEQIRTTISVSSRPVRSRHVGSRQIRIMASDYIDGCAAGVRPAMIFRPKRPTCASKFKRCLKC